MAASEVVGFAKTGGLADVAGSLPRALSRRGHECAVILPLYQCVRTGAIPVAPTEHTLSIPVGTRVVQGRLWQAALPDSTLPVYLVEHAGYFERDNPAQGRGLYQFTLTDGKKRDYPDNCERFTFFCRAVLEAARLLDFRPDVIHNHDWQTGLVPVYLKEEYRQQSGFEEIRTLFTIHNIAYQGIFWHWDMLLTGLDWKLFNFQQLEFYGRLNFLKAGIVFSDLLTTVSPRYAQEIQTPYYGCALEGVLAERRERLFGIVNGVDYKAWDPATDPYLEEKYAANAIAPGKPACKDTLQRRFRLTPSPQTPLLGVVSRLVDQKGINLIIKTADALLQDDAQLVILGEGDPSYHRLLSDLQSRYPDRVGIEIGFDEALAHQIEGGADIFIMPSLFEPSGLNQLYSLKYGTVPVVRATGGLADTIADYTPEALAAGKANGFTFLASTPDAFLTAVRRAIRLYRTDSVAWSKLMQTGMLQDWSWDRSAREYEQLYERLKASNG